MTIATKFDHAPRPQQQRAINTRALLVAAAAHEFASTGYAAASVNTILDTAQCTKGAMYFHFRSKEAMAHAVLDEIHRIYSAVTERWIADDDSVHPLDGIARLVDKIAIAIDGNRTLRAETRLALETRFRTRRPSRTWEKTLTELADNARRAGALRGGIAGETLVHSLVTGLWGARYLTEVHAAGEPLRIAFRETVESAFSAFANEHYLRSFSALRSE